MHEVPDYAFGFSRGAFSIRILLDLVATKGVVHDCGERELRAYSRDAYRAYRQHFKPRGCRCLVALLRCARDLFLARVRWAQKLPLYSTKMVAVPEIAFIGVWDTVAAYGTPIAEITRGIDEWVWPLSMPELHTL